MKIDITKSAIVNAVALVNAANPGLSLEQTQVDFSDVTAVVGTGGRNTSARVYALEGKGLSGAASVSYYRPGLLEQTDTPSLEYTAPEGTGYVMMLVRVCTALGLLLEEMDWQSYVDGVSGETTDAVLAAKPLSLLYQGQIAITITWTDPVPVTP